MRKILSLGALLVPVYGLRLYPSARIHQSPLIYAFSLVPSAFINNIKKLLLDAFSFSSRDFLYAHLFTFCDVLMILTFGST
jgi:hypothetical protein